ncbi:HET-domain-containing protein [Stipitochalara longipes BDJ]|nr:HET-domain-containing protein [Stipitochalara longipes BDJ]
MGPESSSYVSSNNNVFTDVDSEGGHNVSIAQPKWKLWNDSDASENLENEWFLDTSERGRIRVNHVISRIDNYRIFRRRHPQSTLERSGQQLNRGLSANFPNASTLLPNLTCNDSSKIESQVNQQFTDSAAGVSPIFLPFSISKSRIYESLPCDDCIRILEILPGIEDQVQCHLHVALLAQNKFTYEALSYTWELNDDKNSNETSRPSIYCNGLEISSGKNLHDAIRKIRSPGNSKMIWADAICINQDDQKERSQQVAKMGSIYKNAFRVLIWLGKDKSAADISQAFSGIHSIVQSWRDRAEIGDQLRISNRCSDLHVPSSKQLRRESPWLAIFRLYSRRWFHRVWVIQEVALARSAIVLFDDYKIPWESVGLAAAIIRTNYDKINMSSYEIRTMRLKGHGTSGRVIPTGVVNAYLMYRLSVSQQYWKPLRFSLQELLMLTRQFECQGYRDNVFGLLAVPTTDQASQKIVPDYTKSVEEVYLETARAIIDLSEPLALLSSVQRCEERGDGQNRCAGKDAILSTEQCDAQIPSWVPQWHVTLTETINPLYAHPAFNASLGKSTRVKESGDLRKLVLCGVTADIVSSVRYLNSMDFKWTLDPSTLPMSSRDNLSRILKNASYSKTDLEKIAITLTAGKNWYGLPVQDYSAHLADFSRCLLRNGLV